jgi:hypothetical protein
VQCGTALTDPGHFQRCHVEGHHFRKKKTIKPKKYPHRISRLTNRGHFQQCHVEGHHLRKRKTIKPKKQPHFILLPRSQMKGISFLPMFFLRGYWKATTGCAVPNYFAA